MRKINIKEGQMTFGQRIELGRILTDPNLTELDKFRASMVCIDPKFSIREMPRCIDYWAEVLEGITYWIEREKKELHYDPTEEEKAAGIASLSKYTGEMSTIMSLAKDYGKDPDEILGWKYGKVFNILFTNLQGHLYQVRLQKVREKKWKQERERNKWRGRR